MTKFQISVETQVIFHSGKFLVISNSYRGCGNLSRFLSEAEKSRS